MDPQVSNQTPDQPDGQAAPAPNQNVKQQIVERINNAKNVLVTVSTNPTVDELASMLGLTLLLSKLDKHGTAVFSGKVPPAIEFLDPEVTFENSVDSLRDFIIALDKEKADKLRYKVEEDVVKIFITPYKTVLNQKDLQFSQGDFNVDVVIALGVKKREELDKAITAHGRILHDATVITIDFGNQTSELGTIDWKDPNASSVAEMLVSISESFGSGLMDAQISTAFLTGIVAETNRFSNEKTSPKVMTMAAQLMAAGANQQLIASNLRQEGMISEPVRSKNSDQPHDDNGEMKVSHAEEDLKSEQVNTNKNKSKKPSANNQTASASPKQPEPTTKDNENDNKNSKVQQSKTSEPESNFEENTKSNANANMDDQSSEISEANLAEELPKLPELPTPSEQETLQTASSVSTEPELPPLPTQPNDHSLMPSPNLPSVGEPIITTDPLRPAMEKPTFGGTLNATTANAEDDREAQTIREANTNNVALEHQVDTEAQDTALNEARQAIADATAAQPFNPANQPIEALGSRTLPLENQATYSEVALDSSASSMQSAPAADIQPPEQSPVDAFMQPHTGGEVTPSSPVIPEPPVASQPSMPPLPPLPSIDQTNTGMPPLPPLPATPTDPTTGFQPQINPQFMNDLPQSQNTWTQAGQELADKQAEKAEARQAKMDEMTEQYDAAVERNQEIKQAQNQQNPNDPGTFPLPPLQ